MFNVRKPQDDKSTSPENTPLNSHIDKIAQTLDICVKIAEESSKNQPNIFESKIEPKVTIKDYLLRIATYTTINSVSLDHLLTAMLIYVDRFIVRQKYTMNNCNLHRLLLSAFVCAMKFYSDDTFKNVYMAMLGGVDNAEMNELEVTFLYGIEFDLMISEEMFKKINEQLKNVTFPPPVILREDGPCEAKPKFGPV